MRLKTSFVFSAAVVIHVKGMAFSFVRVHILSWLAWVFVSQN